MVVYQSFYCIFFPLLEAVTSRQRVHGDMGVRALDTACHARSLRRGKFSQGEPAHTSVRFPANPPSGESREGLQGRPRRVETVESD